MLWPLFFILTYLLAFMAGRIYECALRELPKSTS